MEIVGGFMMMMSIIGFFLAVVWLIMPFVVFAIKGKQDRTLDVLEAVEARLAAIEARLQLIEQHRSRPEECAGDDAASAYSADGVSSGNRVIPLDVPVVKNGAVEASPVV